MHEPSQRIQRKSQGKGFLQHWVLYVHRSYNKLAFQTTTVFFWHQDLIADAVKNLSITIAIPSTSESWGRTNSERQHRRINVTWYAFFVWILVLDSGNHLHCWVSYSAFCWKRSIWPVCRIPTLLRFLACYLNFFFLLSNNFLNKYTMRYFGLNIHILPNFGNLWLARRVIYGEIQQWTPYKSAIF